MDRGLFRQLFSPHATFDRINLCLRAFNGLKWSQAHLEWIHKCSVVSVGRSKERDRKRRDVQVKIKIKQTIISSISKKKSLSHTYTFFCDEENIATAFKPMVSSVRVCDTNRCVVRLAFSRLGKNNNLFILSLPFILNALRFGNESIPAASPFPSPHFSQILTK
jgi:hypothetical protein